MVLHSGFMVTFEGIDGCGKTTQARLAAEALSAKGQSVVLTRNPGGTGLGQAIRQLVLHGPALPEDAVVEEPVAPLCELMLYMADRAQHWQTVVLPALANGQWVLCDRFTDSTVAYQGYGRGLSLEMIAQLNHMACEGGGPTLTLLYDADPALLAERIRQRGQAADRLEREALAFHQRVRDGFLAQAQAAPDRVVLLDATRSVAELHQQTLACIQERFLRVAQASSVNAC
ncbi:MAG: dTMP kinase [Candidatus Melainabacteria bacterium]|nr:dTMP kinase [Candidatus Melainabacteria bacterium]